MACWLLVEIFNRLSPSFKKSWKSFKLQAKDRESLKARFHDQACVIYGIDFVEANLNMQIKSIKCITKKFILKETWNRGYYRIPAQTTPKAWGF